jgi:amidase
MKTTGAFVPHDLRSPIKGAVGGPLEGLTCAVKDMFDIVGEVAGAGNPAWLADHAPAATNADVITRVLNAGAAITGKTICDEFFYSILGANAHYGTPVNPRTPDRLPGGSSSGSATAVAGGAADFALGSDTGGSVRIPAMANGIYGFRPTHGRVSLRGVLPLAQTFDTVGWFAASAGLLRKIAPVLLQGKSEPAPITNVFRAKDMMALADPAVRAAFARFESRCTGILPFTTEAEVAPDGLDDWRETFRVIQGYEAWQAYGAWLESHDAELGPGTKDRFAYAKTVNEETAESARAHMDRIRSHIRTVVQQGTVLMMPTAPALAPLLTSTPAELDLYRTRVMGFTCLAGLAGLPQISIPAGKVDGVPIGVSLIGWAGADETLLELAVSLGAFCGE